MGTDPLDGPCAASDGAQSEDMREQGIDERQRAADERERTADIRETAADQREAIADEREAIADRREAAADEREAIVGAWQDQLTALEWQLDARRRSAGDPAPSVRERSYEQIVRSQGLLAASQERLERSQAALRRSDEMDLREQDAVNREVGASLTQMATQGPLPLQVLHIRADRLREQAAAAAEALAEAEDGLADEHEQRHSAWQAVEHRQRAEQARTAADTLRDGTTPPEGEPPEGAPPKEEGGPSTLR
ncbi:hypothetical protein [Streptomyces sp. NPDC057694]|uniref:hypothetical protein n=1 Tax=Streptomyces sp. NPDC057694 TaxID=3346216 RepID=UPI0036C25A08